MIVNLLSTSVLGLVGGYVAGCCTPGVIRIIRAKVFGVAKKVEGVVTTVKSDVKKL